jgi:hypothetical protein
MRNKCLLYIIIFSCLLTSFKVYSQSTTCAGATTLTSGVSTIANSNTTAGAVGTNTISCNSGTFLSPVWYEITIAGSGSIAVTLTYNGLSPISHAGLTIYSGTCAAFTDIGCANSKNGPINLSTASCLAAGTYYIMVWNYQAGDQGTFTLKATYTPGPGPGNDCCSAATALGTVNTTTTVVGTNASATADQTSPSCINNYNNNVWYTFTVPATGGTYSISVASGSNIYPDVALFSGTCGAFTSIACNSNCNGDGTGTSTKISTTASCLAAGTYYIAVDDDAASFCGNGATGTFSLTVKQTSAGGPPSNDNCASATNLGTSFATVTSVGDNTCASVDQSPGSCFSGGGFGASINANIWYTFTTGAGTGYTATFTVSSFGGTMREPQLAVYSGTCGSLTELGCGPNSSTTKATLSVGCLAPNTTYYVQVDNYSGQTKGTFTLTAVLTAGAGPPANDNCAGAISLGSVSTTTITTGTNICASADQTSPSCITYDNNVWYKFTIPAGGGSYSFNVISGSSIYPDVAVFSGTCGAFTSVACNSYCHGDGTGTATNILTTANCLAAGTYYIAVDDDAASSGFSCGNGTTGTFSLTVTQTRAGLASSNDLCSGAITLTSATNVGGDNTCAGTAGDPSNLCQFGHDGTISSLWYAYTPATNGSLALALSGGTINTPVISLVSASAACTGYSSCLTLGSGTSSTFSTSPYCVTAGTIYYILISSDASSGSAGTFTLTPTFTPVSSNDACSSATNAGVVSGTYTVSGDNTCATTSTGGVTDPTPSCEHNGLENTLWYTFTTPATIGNATVTVTQGTMDYASVSMFTGSCGSFTQVSCSRGNSNSTGGFSTFNLSCLPASTTYYIMVWDDHSSSAAGTFTLSVNYASSACSGSPTGAVASASNTGGCSSYSTVFSLSGISGCGITYQWQSSTNNSTWTNVPSATSPTYTATINSSTYYQCLITCTSSGSNAASTSVYCSYGAPVNDLCANASSITISANTNIGSYIGTLAGNNTCATADGSNSSCFSVNQNVWYKYTAPVAGNYFVGVTAGSMTYPEISILTGSCGSLAESDCAGASNGGGTIYDSDDTSPYGYSPFSLFSTVYSYGGICSVSAGGTVYIMIDNNPNGNPGSYTVTVATIINDAISTPLIINTCGTNFNSSTIGATNCGNGAGYNNGAENWYNNLDNSATVCNGSAGASGGNGSGGPGSYADGICVNGADVGYSVENDSWYEFCVTATSTITLTFVPIATSCLPAGSTGLQISVFTGSVGSLTKLAGGYNSMDITGSVVYTYPIAINQCTFIEVDGFAGTNCDYSLNAAIIPTCVLSVDLLYFTGLNEQGRIKLNWSSALETNADRYVIERSDNGIDYKTIATVKAIGNIANQTDYSLYDEHPIMNGINYYQLSEFDDNGKGGVLAQTFVSNTGGFPRFAAYPNPSNGKVTVSINNFSVPALTLVIHDVYGRMVWTSDINLSNGTSTQQLDLSSFEPGVYYIETTDGSNFYKQSLVISKNN